MKKTEIEFIEMYLKDSVQLGSIDYFQNEDGEYIFLSQDCILSFKKDYIVLDFDIKIYPDISAFIALGVNDLACELNKEMRIGEVYSFDENYNIYFGEDAVNYSQQNIDERIEDIVKMEHILMFNDGFKC